MAQVKIDDAFLATTKIFSGTEPNEVMAMRGCLGAYARHFDKGTYIYRTGDSVSSLGLVLRGGVNVETVDAWGNTNLLSHVGAGQVFAETYAAVSDVPLLCDVLAVEATDILFLNVARVLTTCSSNCTHHQRVVVNLMQIFARKNLELSKRAQVVAAKTIRGKVLAYLSITATDKGSDEFDIPFNRQQLADYLGVDRSALSAELSRMQREGLIETHRSHFVLNSDAVL